MIHFKPMFNKRFQTQMIKFICITGTSAVTIRHLVTNSISTAKNSETLVGVHMFSRHGARTPLYLVEGLEEVEYNTSLLEPYVKANYALKTLENEDLCNKKASIYDQRNLDRKLKGGAPMGQLTKVGEKQMFELGRRVREKYVNQLQFLEPEYKPSEFYARSSHFRRTINSARCVLAGVYNKSHLDEPSTPFVINVHNLSEDYIFPNAINCEYYQEMHKSFKKLELFTKDENFIKHLNELNRKIPSKKDDENDWITFTRFRDDMIARQIHNEKVPEHFEKDLEKSHHFASKELSAMSTHDLKISCGRLLHMIKSNVLETVSSEKKGHKFRYYSVHDTTLNALLNAFEMIEEESQQWPPFAADIIIELWQEESKPEYFVKLFYCGKEMNFKGSEKGKFTLSQFVKLLEKNEANEDHYATLCSRAFIG